MRPPLLVLAAAVCPGFVALAGAQGLPQAPVTWLGGRVVVSGSVAASTASGGADTSFNEGDYGQDTMRLVELALASSVTLHRALFIAADLRAAGGVGRSDWYARPSTLLLGLRPLGGRPLTVSAGLLQTPFGRAGRGYGRGNFLVGLPLLYQYRSSLAPTYRGRIAALPEPGAYTPPRSATSYGYPPRGLPVVETRGWNAGLRVDAGGDRARLAAAVTRGSLSNPLSRGDSPGWQGAARASTQPVPGFVVGLSAARGRYDRVDGSHAALHETAAGADVEYSKGYWLVRGEVVHSRRDVPRGGAAGPLERLGVTGFDAEGRYRLAPGVYLAARAGRLWFGRRDGAPDSWDANVSRFEGGAGWSPSRPLLIKAAYQYNRRAGGTLPRSLHRAALQALVWF